MILFTQQDNRCAEVLLLSAKKRHLDLTLTAYLLNLNYSIIKSYSICKHQHMAHAAIRFWSY